MTGTHLTAAAGTRRHAIDLLVIGDANPDVLVWGSPETPPADQVETLVESATFTLGGSAAIVAHGASRLGMTTALAAMVGRDAAGDFVLDTLSSAGVDISGCLRHETLPTALTVCLNRSAGDRAILTSPGCLPAFGPEHVPPITARHVHVASYFLQPRLAAGLPTVLASARAVGASTSLDTNHDPAGTWQVAPRLLAECEFLFPNETEALALSTAATLPDALVALAAAGTTPVIKRGAEGAVALRDGRCVSAVGPRAMPVDTVGAGDSFDAGFLADWLDTGDLFRALAAACACGALSTRAGGGTAAQPYADEIAVAAARVQVTEMVTSRD